MQYEIDDHDVNGLDERSLHPDPIIQFKQWYDEILQAGIPEPTAVILATASPEGKPSARVVLLKGVDQQGFVFYTNYESRKARELTATGLGALVFFWKEFDRQVRVEGKVARVTREESARYFATRPRESQLSAWASRQSEPLKDRSELIALFRELDARFTNQEVPLPPFWGGFRLVPDTVEFWVGRIGRLHDRLRYTRKEGGWVVERLAP